LGEVESTKSVADVYSPVSGLVADTNAEVRLSPELINTDPYGRGWLVKVEGGPGQLEELMAAAYRSLVSAEESRAG